MPYTDFEKQAIIQAHGLDPSQYTLDDAGQNIISRSASVSPQQPNLSSPEILTFPQPNQSNPQQSSAIGAFGKSLAQAAPGAVGGGLAAGGAAALLGAGGALDLTGIGAPIGIPLQLAGIALAGYGGSKAVQAVQNQVEPLAMQQAVAQAQAEHPTAAFLGNLASMPLGGMSPSPTGLMKAAGGIPKLLTGQALTPIEKYFLLNSAAGAGLGAGQTLIEGGSGKDIAQSAALGALFNKPNIVGRAYGFHDQLPQDLNQILQNQAPLQNSTDVQQPQVQTIPPASPVNRYDLDLLNRMTSAPGIFRSKEAAEIPLMSQQEKQALQSAGLQDVASYLEGRTTIKSTKTKQGVNRSGYIPQYSAAESALNMDQLLREQQTQQSQSPETLLRAADYERAKQELLSQQMKTALMYRDMIEQQNTPVEKKNWMAGNTILTTPPEVSAPYRHSDYTPTELKEQQQSPLAKGNTTQYAADTIQEAQDKPLQATKNWFDIFKAWLPANKGIHLDTDGVPVNAEGKPVAGQTLLENGLPKLLKANVAGGMAAADTVPHEVQHAIMAAMEQSGRPRDKAFMKRYYDIISQSPEYQEWASRTTGDNSPNEYAAQNGGFEFLRRHLNLDNESSFKTWLNDVSSYWKTRFGSHADEADYRRMMNYELLYGKTRLGPGNVAVGAPTVIKNSEDDLINKLWPDYKTKKDLIGHISNDTATSVPVVNSLKELHQDHNMYSGWRYVDKDNMVHWDYPPSEHEKQLVNAHIEAKRFKTPRHTNFWDTSTRYQDQSPLSDRQQYENVNAKLMDLMRQGKHDSPEFQQAWQEMENIKNRNGGMPPAKVEQQNSEESPLKEGKVSPDDDKVLGIFRSMIGGDYKDPDLAEEAQNALKDQVDWSKYPNIHHILSSENFDSGELNHWRDLLQIYANLRKEAGPVNPKKVAPEPTKTSLERVNTANPTFNDLHGAIQRRNVEPDGDVYYHGDKIHPTDEYIAQRKPAILADIQKQKDKIEELEAAKKAKPDASVKEIREHLPADSSITSWDGAISQAKYQLKDAQDHWNDHVLANRVWNATHPKVNEKGFDVVNPQEKPEAGTTKTFIRDEPDTGNKFRVTQDKKTGNIIKQELLEKGKPFTSEDPRVIQPLEALSEQDQQARLNQIKKEWDEVYNTKYPSDLAARMRDDYARANEYALDLQRQNDVGRKYQTAVSRMQQLKMMYEELKAKHGLKKVAPIDDGLTKLNSEESPLKDQAGEGRTPYPFRMNELEKGTQFQDSFEEYAKAAPMLSHVTPSEEQEAKAFLNPQRNQDYSALPLVKPALDVVREKANEHGNGEGDVLHAAYNKYAQQKDNIYGKGMYPILRAAQGLSEKELNHVEDVGIKEFRDKQFYNNQLSAKERPLYDAIRQSLLEKQNDQRAANQPVVGAGGVKRLPQIDPYYWPNKMSRSVADALADPKLKAKKQQMYNDFIQHNIAHGVSQQQAEAKWNQISHAYDKGEVNLSKFNANREMEGVGLPDSMLQKGKPLQSISSYFNRVAADRAFHDNFEANPDAAKVIGLKDDPWGNAITSTKEDSSNIPEVKHLMEKVYGEGYDPTERELKSLNRVATAMMLGPLTNIHIAASSVANSIQYTRPTYTVQAMMHGLTHLTDGIQHALKTGYLRKDLTPVRDILSAQSDAIDRLNGIAKLIGNLGGRNIVNEATKGYLQAFGEYVVKQKMVEANGGSKEAINLMKHIDPEWSQGKQYSQEELQQKASNFASIIHGAHDARTLPNWMLHDTAIQPFFSLASWNLAQTNAWMRHVWTPAKQGNLTPLIMSTLGATLGGYVIKELREKVADKKSAIPSLNELVNSSRGLEGNTNNVAYNLMAMSSYVGYAGILSVLGKAVEDVAHKNIPQGAAFPLDEVISNPAKRISQYVSALITDPNFDYVNSSLRLMTDIAKENVQLARLGISWGANLDPSFMPQEHYLKEVNKKTQDLRRWQMAEGIPYEAQTVNEANPYLNQNIKTFKRTQDVGEAASLLPTLIQNALTKANGNPDVLKNELQKIKQNSYETMPNPERMPISFARYMAYLSQRDGPEEASQRLTDYFLHNTINKAKSQMVPSVP